MPSKGWYKIPQYNKIMRNMMSWSAAYLRTSVEKVMGLVFGLTTFYPAVDGLG
jgi:hypothetical protein